MAPPRTPSSELVDDAIIDVLLRLPPEEPALLVRASLVCRQWRRVLSDPDFLRLYARVHRTPPLLGFFDSYLAHYYLPGYIPRFVPVPTMAAASRFSSSSLAPSPWLVLDCRHGRVLLQRRQHAADDDALSSSIYQQLVWDPITGDGHELRWPSNDYRSSASVYVVLCAAGGGGCDHSGCRGGPFLVLCAGVRVHRAGEGVGCGRGAGATAYACVYSSQLRAWGSPALSYLHALLYFHDYHRFAPSRRGVVIGDEVYLFLFSRGDQFQIQRQILKYDMCRHRLSVIDLPDLYGMGTGVQLMATEDGLLGLASTDWSSSGYILCLWSRTADAEAVEGVAGWVRRRVIDLRMISFASNRIINSANVIGFAEGVNAILVGTNAGTFVIDLKTEQARKVCNAGIDNPVVPFMTFYSPGCACGKLPLPVEQTN